MLMAISVPHFRRLCFGRLKEEQRQGLALLSRLDRCATPVPLVSLEYPWIGDLKLIFHGFQT
jgi:hypothetical protein